MLAMGMWLAGTVVTAVVAAENFYTIDRLLVSSPSTTFVTTVERVGRGEAREFLRYLSSELNRLYFRLWNVAQLVIGVLLLWLIGRDAGAAKARRAVILMLGIVVVMTVWLAPEVSSIGRSLDFVPRDPPPSAVGRFWILHAAYTSLTLFNLIAGVSVGVWIARGRS